MYCHIYKICQLIKLITTYCRSLSQARCKLLVIPEKENKRPGGFTEADNAHIQEGHYHSEVQELIIGGFSSLISCCCSCESIAGIYWRLGSTQLYSRMQEEELVS